MIPAFFKPHQERIGRMVGMVVFLFFTVRQLLPASMGGMFPGFEQPLPLIRWVLISVLFLLFLHAYIVRTPALELANKPSEILLPLICGPLPLVIIIVFQLSYSVAPFHQWLMETGLLSLFQPLHDAPAIVTTGLIMMAAGEVITIAGMLTLRASFSIFSEVRELRQTGLYRYVRHPLYTGELISIWGYAVVVPCAWTIGGALLFTPLQMMRAKVEERKIEKHHPEYAQYRQKVGFLLPRI